MKLHCPASNQRLSMATVQPFQFEPERKVTPHEENEDSDFEHEEERGQTPRVGHHRWCLCYACVSMGTERESLCCKELPFLWKDVQRK